jgi:threonine aldolase
MGLPGVTIAYPVEANAVFVTLPSTVTQDLQRDRPFYVWDTESGMVRWMTAFDTTEDDVDRLVDAVAGLTRYRP